MDTQYSLKDYIKQELGISRSSFFFFEVFKRKFLSPTLEAVLLVRTMIYFYQNKKGKISKIIVFFTKRKLVKKYNCFISEKSRIGIGMKLPHPSGIVIGKNVEIGNNVVIYQQVTLGAQRRGEGKLGAYPIIEDNCILYAGSKIVGPIIIGENSKIGANAVVTKSFEKNSTIVGIPGKKIQK